MPHRTDTAEGVDRAHAERRGARTPTPGEGQPGGRLHPAPAPRSSRSGRTRSPNVCAGDTRAGITSGGGERQRPGPATHPDGPLALARGRRLGDADGRTLAGSVRVAQHGRRGEPRGAAVSVDQPHQPASAAVLDQVGRERPASLRASHRGRARRASAHPRPGPSRRPRRSPAWPGCPTGAGPGARPARTPGPSSLKETVAVSPSVRRSRSGAAIGRGEVDGRAAGTHAHGRRRGAHEVTVGGADGDVQRAVRRAGTGVQPDGDRVGHGAARARPPR